MPASQPPFDLADVRSRLAGTRFDPCIHHLASTESTNSLALDAAQQGVHTGVWVADEQTAGRGRSNHSWHSSANDGLYLSVLVRPRLFGVEALKLSLATGLAARSAIAREAGLSIDLRWPNDLMILGRDGVERKCGGILTESAMEGGDGALSYAVIGIGINLNHAIMPEPLRAIATSLRIESATALSRERLLASLLRELEAELTLVEAEASGTRHSSTSPLSVRFAHASTWVRGARVHVDEDGGYTGITDGLDAHGLLEVRLDDGSRRKVRHGGVRRAGVPTPRKENAPCS